MLSKVNWDLMEKRINTTILKRERPPHVIAIIGVLFRLDRQYLQ